MSVSVVIALTLAVDFGLVVPLLKVVWQLEQ
jgi:hypothetical protein